MTSKYITCALTHRDIKKALDLCNWYPAMDVGIACCSEAQISLIHGMIEEIRYAYPFDDISIVRRPAEVVCTFGKNNSTLYVFNGNYRKRFNRIFADERIDKTFQDQILKKLTKEYMINEDFTVEDLDDLFGYASASLRAPLFGWQKDFLYCLLNKAITTTVGRNSRKQELTNIFKEWYMGLVGDRPTCQVETITYEQLMST